jgi:hypothetical protein
MPRGDDSTAPRGGRTGPGSSAAWRPDPPSAPTGQEAGRFLRRQDAEDGRVDLLAEGALLVGPLGDGARHLDGEVDRSDDDQVAARLDARLDQAEPGSASTSPRSRASWKAQRSGSGGSTPRLVRIVAIC